MQRPQLHTLYLHATHPSLPRNASGLNGQGNVSVQTCSVSIDFAERVQLQRHLVHVLLCCARALLAPAHAMTKPHSLCWP